ncbi:MAG: hypothetical protein RQ966_18290 [Acetobacteraceae bacterium]|nr:hypothetical protein [Acetobacteraceae bacterium]
MPVGIAVAAAGDPVEAAILTVQLSWDCVSASVSSEARGTDNSTPFWIGLIAGVIVRSLSVA